MRIKYRVTLSAEEREQLSGMIGVGKAAARKLQHARILLKADQAEDGPTWTDEQIVAAAGRPAVPQSLRYAILLTVEEGLDACLEIGSGPQESPISQTGWSAGSASGGRGVQRTGSGRTIGRCNCWPTNSSNLQIVAAITGECVRKTLKKMNSNRGLKESSGFCRRHTYADFVCAMEDTLEGVSTSVRSPASARFAWTRPGKQLVADVRAPVAGATGPASTREDYEYQRAKARPTCSCSPNRWPAGVKCALRNGAPPLISRKSSVRWLTHLPIRTPKKIVLVMDNLNTHKPASLLRSVSARRSAPHFGTAGDSLHPNYGSWLNMAKIELGVLSRQCLNRRIEEERQELKREVAAWGKPTQSGANAKSIGASPPPTPALKLKRLYPSIERC